MFTRKALTACLALALLAGLCACSHDFASPPAGAAQAAEQPQRITAPGDYSFSFDHDGITRSYLVHVPPQYSPGHPAPLLVSLHGGGGSMNYQASDENYGQISASNRHGFVVVFPNGYSRLPGGILATWNAGRCCGPARDRNIDDVGFIRELIGRLRRQLDLDPNRIFATGMSNGAMMAQRLACELPGTIRAIAAVAGTDNTGSCAPAQPVSVLEIHAKDDDHVPFNGGLGPKSLAGAVTDFTSVPESVARWVRRDRCPTQPQRVLATAGAYCDRYAPCAGGAAVELCVTDTGAHSWPGASRSRGSEPPSQALSANDVMWHFFMQP